MLKGKLKNIANGVLVIHVYYEDIMGNVMPFGDMISFAGEESLCVFLESIMGCMSESAVTELMGKFKKTDLPKYVTKAFEGDDNAAKEG